MNRLIPPPELAPPSIRHLSAEKRVELWLELLDENDALVRAKLRADIGPHGDFEAAYRSWCERQWAEHERKQIQFLQNLSDREAGRDK